MTSLTELATAALAESKRWPSDWGYELDEDDAFVHWVATDAEGDTVEMAIGHEYFDDKLAAYVVLMANGTPLLAAGMLAALTANADLTRELERWKHGAQIEGDYVCPDSLALSEALRVNVDLTRQLAEARAEIERLQIALHDEIAKLRAMTQRTVRIEIVNCGTSDDCGIRLIVDGALVDTNQFGGEPEDNTEGRDYAWVKEMLASLARKLGATATIEHVDIAAPDGLSWPEVEKAARHAFYEEMYKP